MRTSKLRVTGLCAGNSPVTGEFPAQMASNAENVSIWWRHHAPGLLHWHQGNRMVGLVPVKQYWRIQANDTYDRTQNYVVHEIKQGAYLMGYTVWLNRWAERMDNVFSYPSSGLAKMDEIPSSPYGELTAGLVGIWMRGCGIYWMN